jgi:two-component system, cell cycle sensor histidine kinase and response regulator CckA
MENPSNNRLSVLDQIVCSAAHDLNNMLTVIASQAKLLELKTGSCQELSNHFADIDLALERASRMTHQLISYSKMLPEEQNVIDLNAIIERMTPLYQQLVGPGIVIKCKFDPSLPSIKANRNLVELAILNLVINSRDAMPNGGIVVIETETTDYTPLHEFRSEEEEKLFAMVTVTDNGLGMPKSIRDKVLEPFFTTKPPTKGTGLGLYNVRELLRKLHGYLKIDSIEGHGTSVRMFYPSVVTFETVSH